jgi:hypothetical protein
MPKITRELSRKRIAYLFKKRNMRLSRKRFQNFKETINEQLSKKDIPILCHVFHQFDIIQTIIIYTNRATPLYNSEKQKMDKEDIQVGTQIPLDGKTFIITAINNDIMGNIHDIQVSPVY